LGRSRIAARRGSIDQVENVGVRGETERAGLFYVESSVSSIVSHGQDVYGRTGADVFVNGSTVTDTLKDERFDTLPFYLNRPRATSVELGSRSRHGFTALK